MLGLTGEKADQLRAAITAAGIKTTATVQVGTELEITNDSGNPIPVAGTAADAAAASGSPVDVAGEHLTSPPILTNMQHKRLQVDVNGNLKSREQYAPVYEDNTNGKAVIEHRYTPTRVTADTQVKASAGFIHTVTIAPSGTVTAGVLSIYDSASESGTVLLSIALPVTTFAPFTVTLDVTTATGIYVGFDGTLANVNALLSWR